MRRKYWIGLIIGMLVMALPCWMYPASAEARQIVEKAFEYMRGDTSHSEVTMTIHRSDFERTMGLLAWTRGKEEAIFFVKSPAKDEGNGTLKIGKDMWSYNPKINRVIKLPPSMMSQSWMGSDFSNDDLSKTESILDEYTHRILGPATGYGLPAWNIELIPLELAPVVWGKQELTIREDGVLLRQAFFDQDMELVKEMITQDIQEMGGRDYPRVWTMTRADDPNRYTRLVYETLEFDEELAPRLFTQSNLRNPRS
jgi:outer membrane lipoprotein-sorting protein